ncbi:MAG: amidophosphoribosyltransferase, partial [Actinomycetota bacterium]
TLGCTQIEEVQPGEVIVMQGASLRRIQAVPAAKVQSRCTFEFIYFSRPDSEWDGMSVHQVRQQLGERLAKEHPVDADVVIPVPDSSIPAAIGYSRVSGIPYNDGLIKNRYIARTFIEPSQALRERRVAMKFNALSENLRDRRVVVIDDSLVRGTTAGPLVRLIREAGAAEVHLRITSPPIRHPCFMGVDMGTYDELIAARLDPEELRRHVGSDSLEFLSIDGMMTAIASSSGFCTACFSGEYRFPIDVERVTGEFVKVRGR